MQYLEVIATVISAARLMIELIKLWIEHKKSRSDSGK